LILSPVHTIVLLTRGLIIISIIALLTATVIAEPSPHTRLRIAVLDFGKTTTGQVIREAISKRTANDPNVTLVDRDQAMMAASGAGYRGSLNLSLLEARDLGSAVGSDFLILGNADTLRRSPSDGPVFFESYVSIFIVSARTGRLVMWESQIANRPTANDAEKVLLGQLSAAIDRYMKTIFRAAEDESAERALAVEQPKVVIEAMSDNAEESDDGTRPPRPFRRLKPPYPDAAAHAQVEAVVDVLVDVDEKGEVSRAGISRWAGYGLEESVMTTVKQLHFFPAMRNGRAIPMRVLLRYNFRKPSDTPLQ
jgi:TonB family protein